MNQETNDQNQSKSLSLSESQKSVSPANLTHEDRELYFENKISRASSQLKPAGNDYVEKLLTTIAVTQQCKIPAPEALLKYFDLLSDYPEDLLHMAGNYFLTHCTYQKFPLISELTTEIEEILQNRKRNLRDLEISQQDYINPVKINNYQSHNRMKKLSGSSALKSLKPR